MGYYHECTYIGLHVKCPLFLSHINVAWIRWTDLEKFSNIKFQQNPPNGNQVVPCAQTDGRTGRRTTNLTVVFRNSAKASKHVCTYTWNHPLYSAVHPILRRHQTTQTPTDHCQPQVLHELGSKAGRLDVELTQKKTFVRVIPWHVCTPLSCVHFRSH
jgi:hypothetical protein